MSAIPEPNPEERLSRADVEATLKGLSPADWRRAASIASFLCGGLTGWTPDDLLQEALCNLLDETRIWRSGLHPLVVLKTAMRGIASNARKHNKASPVDESVVVDPTALEEDGKTPVAHGRVTVTPEDEFSGKEQIEKLFAALATTEDLGLLAMTWADSLRGIDACEALEWDMKKYDAARNRLLRRLNALDPDRRAK